MPPVISRINIYPVKSLDGMHLQEAVVGEGNCLKHDREFALSSSDGRLVIGKNNQKIYRLRSKINLRTNEVSFRETSELEWQSFSYINDKDRLESYLSDYFGEQIYWAQNGQGRFMDIPDDAGITIVSEESLKAVAKWFDLSIEETRLRFRATVEIKNVEAFWEDQLFAEPGKNVKFQLGDLSLYGTSPRARCSVPPHQPQTGEIMRLFQKTFATKRSETLPKGSFLPLYEHFYFLAVDCRIASSQIGKSLKIGDVLKLG